MVNCNGRRFKRDPWANWPLAIILFGLAFVFLVAVIADLVSLQTGIAPHGTTAGNKPGMIVTQPKPFGDSFPRVDGP